MERHAAAVFIQVGWLASQLPHSMRVEPHAGKGSSCSLIPFYSTLNRRELCPHVTQGAEDTRMPRTGRRVVGGGLQSCLICTLTSNILAASTLRSDLVQPPGPLSKMEKYWNIAWLAGLHDSGASFTDTTRLELVMRIFALCWF